MREYEAGILHTERRGPSSLLIDLECSGIALAATPGQFVQVRVTEGSEPFLRRTFSICGCDPAMGTIRLLIDIVGRGTAILDCAKRGGILNIIGPLGSGFDPAPGSPGHWMLVAGGVGAAPLLFLAKRLAEDSTKQVTFIMGARTGQRLEILDGMLPDAVRVLQATDDGSVGHHGTAAELLEKLIHPSAPDMIAACGPHPMLKAVARIACSRGVSCVVSLEERMACGLGACLGCAVSLADGRMARSCVDGPVFDAEVLAW